MADTYNANGVVVNQDAIVVNGAATDLKLVLRAEAYQIENWIRNAIIFVFGCIAPIAAMVAATQMFLVQRHLNDEHSYMFGPIVLVASVAAGLIAAAIGLYWPKPWGVVIERPEFGFGTLAGSPSKEEAEKLANAINEAIEKRDS